MNCSVDFYEVSDIKYDEVMTSGGKESCGTVKSIVGLFKFGKWEN